MASISSAAARNHGAWFVGALPPLPVLVALRSTGSEPTGAASAVFTATYASRFRPEPVSLTVYRPGCPTVSATGAFLTWTSSTTAPSRSSVSERIPDVASTANGAPAVAVAGVQPAAHRTRLDARI